MANNNQPANNTLNNGAMKLREIALKLATDAINKARAAGNNAKPNNGNNKPANNGNNKPANNGNNKPANNGNKKPNNNGNKKPNNNKPANA